MGDELPAPAPVARALDALEDAGWDTEWEDEGLRVIHVRARRGRWRLRTSFRREIHPSSGSSRGWKAGNVAIRDGRRTRWVKRRSLAPVAQLTDEQLDHLLSDGQVEGIQTTGPR